jgi:hypothetical protein
MKNRYQKVALFTLALGAPTTICTLAAGKLGPLNPPSGAVSSSNRTLQEIYDKIPAAASLQGWTPIAGSTTGRSINSPGKYILTGDVSGSGLGIDINADNVTLDLNGFTISTSGAGGSIAVSINNARKNVTLRNGAVSNANIGIIAGNTQTNLTLEDLDITGCKLNGVYLFADTNKHILVRRLRVLDTGLSSVAADNYTTINGLYFAGAHVHVEDCSVQRMAWNGAGNPSISGIRLPTGSGSGGVGYVVDHCTVTLDAFVTGTGIWTSGAGVHRNNFSQGFTTPYNLAGTNGGGNF